MKILLAEDDPNISTIAKLTLEKLGGHNVTVVHDGEQALNQALAGQYDVILLDEMMPKMNGLRVSEALHANNKFNTPIIFLSAKSQESDVRAFHEHGNGFIPKPFDPMLLAGQIKAILEAA